jgi:hypothetical protein
MTIRTITLSITSVNEGIDWSANFSVDDAVPIKNIVNFALTCPTNTNGNFSVPNTASISNVMNGFSTHYGGGSPTSSASSTDDSYVTWRSTTATSGQFPSSGESMDIWSYSFYNDIMYDNKTWAQIGNGATYLLNPRKYSLIYNYTSRSASVFSKGGTLTVSVV